MSILKTLEATAADLKTQMGPMAGRMRDTADELMDRLGTESRQLGEMMGERLAAQLEQVPETALKRMSLVPAKKSRRRMILGLIFGLVIGAVAMAVLNKQKANAEQLRSGGWDQEPAATGDLPK